jgi:hypothetical protein
MHGFEFPAGTVPDGSAVPFYFYDEFMKHNDFYELIDDVLADSEFQQNREVQRRELKRIRSLIKQGTMPGWMTTALTKAQASFPTRLQRCGTLRFVYPSSAGRASRKIDQASLCKPVELPRFRGARLLSHRSPEHRDGCVAAPKFQ